MNQEILQQDKENEAEDTESFQEWIKRQSISNRTKEHYWTQKVNFFKHSQKILHLFKNLPMLIASDSMLGFKRSKGSGRDRVDMGGRIYIYYIG